MNRMDRTPNESIDALMEAVLKLDTLEESRAFFSDLCTVQELQLMAQRLQVAKRLKEGATYEEIRQELAVSSTTITRINTTLQYGAGGYYTVLDRLEQQDGRENA